MSTILLTGARAPVTLELARHLSARGHRVLVADSVSTHPCRRSRAVVASFVIPPPAQDFAGFVSALTTIVQHNGVTWLIPTCEEIFWVARGLPELQSHCQVLAPELSILRTLHSKWLFIEHLKALGIRVPRTWLLESPADLQALQMASDCPKRLVFKPVFSRFASRVHFWQAGEPWPKLVPGLHEQWVAQAWIAGQGVCTYGVAHNGVLQAHAAYPVRFTASQGACISFESLPDPHIRAWVEQVVSALSVTGQVAFDLIVDEHGHILPLECNPRATSGVHLFDGDGRFADALLGNASEAVTPGPNAAAMLGLAMLVYGLPDAMNKGVLADWWRLFWHARDAVWRLNDPLPMLDLALTFGSFGYRARQQGLSVAQMMTSDIEWNGQP